MIPRNSGISLIYSRPSYVKLSSKANAIKARIAALLMARKSSDQLLICSRPLFVLFGHKESVLPEILVGLLMDMTILDLHLPTINSKRRASINLNRNLIIINKMLTITINIPILSRSMDTQCIPCL